MMIHILILKVFHKFSFQSLQWNLYLFQTSKIYSHLCLRRFKRMSCLGGLMVWIMLQYPLNLLMRIFRLVWCSPKIPGLNTLGISLARIDYAPLGENPPHTHPRATEILTVLEGTLYVGFVTSNQNNVNKLFTKTLNKGDVFVFPEGLIHFQFNPCPDKPAVALAALSSQNPGAITIANAVFGSKPPISDDVLARAFQVEKKTVDWLQAQFWADNHN